MYRYSNGQISLSDFQQPMGMRLREDNRWVKKAQSIPWDKIEEKYADLFPSETGNVAKPLQLALGACLIQREYGYSDVETVLQIQENPYLQYFCGYAGYDDSKLPFDASSMVHFRKRLTPEVLAQINEMVIQEAQKTEDNDNQDDNKPDGGGNSGTIIVDATCAPSNIRYPQDVSLLNEARENAEKLLDILHSPTDGKKPRTYRKRARKDYLKYVRCRKHTAKMTRKAIGKQLNYLKRDLAAIDGKLNQEKALNIHQTERLETIRKIYEQQKYMYDNHTHSVENRIVSVSQPFVRPIVRGKVGKPVEFGMKLDISVTDGWTRLEYRSFDAYNEATKLQEMIENFHKREGHYPSRVLADKIYRNRENLSYCKARGIRLSGPALGRPKKGEDRNKAQDYRDECERVEVERKFSLGKRKCGMGLVTAKLEETAAHVVALSILLLNLRKIQCAFLQFLDWLLGLLQSREKRMVIQWTLFRAIQHKERTAKRSGKRYNKEVKKQLTMSLISDELGQASTKTNEFLGLMEKLIPWSQWVGIVQPHYYKGERGNKPYDLELMLRIYVLQHLYNLADDAARNEIIDSRAFSQFCGVDSSNQVPDGDTIGRFRHILERNQLGEAFFTNVVESLQKCNLMLKKGTIVDSTLIAVPSSTKNKEKQRDPEAHSVKKGNQCA